jgi:aminocarboxymuconate-semialdehyde decarboxylase
MVGAILHCQVAAWTPDREELQPVFERLAALERPVALHPAIFQFGPAEVFEDWMLWASIAPMFETSITAARIIYSGLLDRVPELVVVVPHLGGVLPFLTQRLADLSKTGAAEHDALWYMQNRLLFDSCNLFGPALDLTAATVGADRIMFGSDYPARGSVKRNVDHIRESSLGDDAKQAILAGTAERYGFERTAL